MVSAFVFRIRQCISPWALELLIAMAGGCFLAIASQLAIPLPFTPVPLTLQTLAIFVLGGILGSRRSMYSVFAYLVQCCCGLPVLAGGGVNPFWIVDPKAGFLISFIVAAFLIGKMTEKRAHISVFYLLMTLLVGQITISSMGMIWLAVYVGWAKAFFFGVVPFLSGAVIKIIAGAFILKGYQMCRGSFAAATMKF
ncbi:MAG: biotin transporter BioY [Simkania sp.]|nr:biotin transporter BioY [Simkania sp.]